MNAAGIIGNGTIEKEGWESGYGKYIRIRHTNGYETAYGHMSAYARGIEDDDLIRLFNHRGSVVCAAQLTDRLRPGAAGTHRSSRSMRRSRPSTPYSRTSPCAPATPRMVRLALKGLG